MTIRPSPSSKQIRIPANPISKSVVMFWENLQRIFDRNDNGSIFNITMDGVSHFTTSNSNKYRHNFGCPFTES